MRKALSHRWLTMMVGLHLLFPVPLLAVNVPFDTTPEGFQGQSDLVNFLNKFQLALIIVLVMLFCLSIVRMEIDRRSGNGIKGEATGAILCVVGIVVVSNPAYWIGLISSWFGQ